MVLPVPGAPQRRAPCDIGSVLLSLRNSLRRSRAASGFSPTTSSSVFGAVSSLSGLLLSRVLIILRNRSMLFSVHGSSLAQIFFIQFKAPETFSCGIDNEDKYSAIGRPSG